MSAIQYCGLILIMLNARLPLHDQIITGVIRRLHSQSGYESNGDFSTVTMLRCASRRNHRGLVPLGKAPGSSYDILYLVVTRTWSRHLLCTARPRNTHLCTRNRRLPVVRSTPDADLPMGLVIVPWWDRAWIDRLLASESTAMARSGVRCRNIHILVVHCAERVTIEIRRLHSRSGCECNGDVSTTISGEGCIRQQARTLFAAVYTAANTTAGGHGLAESPTHSE